eukprot:tig00020572_g11543.t1
MELPLPELPELPNLNPLTPTNDELHTLRLRTLRQRIGKAVFFSSALLISSMIYTSFRAVKPTWRDGVVTATLAGSAVVIYRYYFAE